MCVHARVCVCVCVFVHVRVYVVCITILLIGIILLKSLRKHSAVSLSHSLTQVQQGI